jgi:hypothetical protein
MMYSLVKSNLLEQRGNRLLQDEQEQQMKGEARVLNLEMVEIELDILNWRYFDFVTNENEILEEVVVEVEELIVSEMEKLGYLDVVLEERWWEVGQEDDHGIRYFVDVIPMRVEKGVAAAVEGEQ